MARTVTPKGPSRSTSKAPAKPASRIAAPKARPAAKPAARAAAPRAPQPTKEELRARVEKLERANATLRTKNRDLKRAAERIAELEEELERLRASAPRRGRARGGRSERDPGDAVPPGVAVLEPEPLSESDREVLDHMNAELSPGPDEGDEDEAAEG